MAFIKKKEKYSLTARDLMIITLVVFLVLSLASTAVYMISGKITRFAPAFFESVSAFTTTGASVFIYAIYLPPWLKVFRAVCQWIGGAGSLIFFACILNATDRSFGVVSHSEGSNSMLYRAGIRFRSVVRKLLLTYLIMTAAQFLLLMISGVSALNSVCTAMSTVSTGGFISDAVINNGMTETVMMVFMMLTCINYTAYYHIIKKHYDNVGKSSELKAFFGILIGACVLIVASLMISGTYGFRESVENGIFHVVSSMTTTGYAIADTTRWPEIAKYVLSILSFIGGSTLSLGSGLKILRIVVIFKLIGQSFTVRIHPRAVSTIKVNGKSMPESAASEIAVMGITYFAAFILSVFIVSFFIEDLSACFTIAASLFNNVGTDFSTFEVFTYYSDPAFILFSIIMLVGRLELFTVLLPVSKDKNS